MTSQKLCEHVGRIASCMNREAYEWQGSTVLVFCKDKNYRTIFKNYRTNIYEDKNYRL